MGKCTIDHSKQDIQKKFETQKEFLPETINMQISQFLTKESSQETLNELFHLLKKYDLAPKEEREKRNQKILALTNE